MNNNTIRVALSSVLIYVTFKKLYDLLTTLMLWLNVELKIDNEVVIISLNIFLGLFSVFALIFLANKVLSKEIIENYIIYVLVGLTASLTGCLFLLNKYYGEYLANSEFEDFYTTYLFQYGWGKILDFFIPVAVLLYFLWKMEGRTGQMIKRENK